MIIQCEIHPSGRKLVAIFNPELNFTNEGSKSKINTITQLGFELAHYDFTVQNVNPNAKEFLLSAEDVVIIMILLFDDNHKITKYNLGMFANNAKNTEKCIY